MVMTICRLMMISTGGCNFLFRDDDSLRSDISYDILYSYVIGYTLLFVWCTRL